MDKVRKVIKALLESDDLGALRVSPGDVIGLITELNQQLQEANSEKVRLEAELTDIKDQVQSSSVVDLKFSKLAAAVQSSDDAISEKMGFWNQMIADAECDEHGVTEEYAADQVKYFSAQGDLTRQLLDGINPEKTDN